MHITTILLFNLAKPSAYLDPGSGSIILQLLIAVLLGGGILIKSFWGKIFRKGPKPDEKADNPTDEDSSSKKG